MKKGFSKQQLSKEVKPKQSNRADIAKLKKGTEDSNVAGGGM